MGVFGNAIERSYKFLLPLSAFYPFPPARKTLFNMFPYLHFPAREQADAKKINIPVTDAIELLITFYREA